MRVRSVARRAGSAIRSDIALESTRTNHPRRILATLWCDWQMDSARFVRTPKATHGNSTNGEFCTRRPRHGGLPFNRVTWRLATGQGQLRRPFHKRRNAGSILANVASLDNSKCLPSLAEPAISAAMLAITPRFAPLRSASATTVSFRSQLGGKFL